MKTLAITFIIMFTLMGVRSSFWAIEFFTSENPICFESMIFSFLAFAFFMGVREQYRNHLKSEDKE